MSTCHTHVREAREISSQKLYSTSLSYKMEENEESSVNVTNDSEDSNAGEGLINCYGSPVGRIAVSHRNTALPGTSREGSRVVSSIDFGNISQ